MSTPRNRFDPPSGDRDRWSNATSSQTFGEYIRNRTPSGMDEDEQRLADALVQRARQLQSAAEQAFSRLFRKE